MSSNTLSKTSKSKDENLPQHIISASNKLHNFANKSGKGTLIHMSNNSINILGTRYLWYSRYSPINGYYRFRDMDFWHTSMYIYAYAFDVDITEEIVPKGSRYTGKVLYVPSKNRKAFEERFGVDFDQDEIGDYYAGIEVRWDIDIEFHRGQGVVWDPNAIIDFRRVGIALTNFDWIYDKSLQRATISNKRVNTKFSKYYKKNLREFSKKYPSNAKTTITKYTHKSI